jgi:hypothetical protein
VGHSHGASHQRGSIALYLLFSIAASIAVGYAVYLLIRDRKLAVADDAVAEPAPARPASRPEAIAEPPVDVPAEPPEGDTAERDAVEPNVIVSDEDAVLLGTPGIAGGLAREDVTRTIKRYAVRYERCMRRARDRGVTPGGSLRLTFVISAEGNVDYATGRASNVDEELATCVVDVIEKLRFERSMDGAKVKVVYPIAFVAAASTDPLDTID